MCRLPDDLSIMQDQHGVTTYHGHFVRTNGVLEGPYTRQQAIEVALATCKRCGEFPDILLGELTVQHAFALTATPMQRVPYRKELGLESRCDDHD